MIWGDFWPCCQPAGQSDFLSGGDGNDYLYASHGSNGISGGSGNDVIHAHFGQGGTIYCGSGLRRLVRKPQDQAALQRTRLRADQLRFLEPARVRFGGG